MGGVSPNSKGNVCVMRKKTSNQKMKRKIQDRKIRTHLRPVELAPAKQENLELQLTREGSFGRESQAGHRKRMGF